MCDDSVITREVSSLCSSVERLSIRTWAEAPDFYDVTKGEKKITELCSINYRNPGGWGGGGEQAACTQSLLYYHSQMSFAALHGRYQKASTKKMDALTRLTY